MNPDAPRITIERLSPANWEGAALALASAFQDDPLVSFVAPNAEARRRWLPIMMSRHLALTEPEGHTYVARDEATGEIVGAMGLFPPGKSAPLGRSLVYMAHVALRPNPWTPSIRHLLKSLVYMTEWERMRVKEPHWYVYLVGVRAEAQGRGAGRALMERALQLGRESGDPIYLETQNEKNLRFYRACGLEVIERIHPNPAGPRSWGMLQKRPAEG